MPPPVRTPGGVRNIFVYLGLETSQFRKERQAGNRVNTLMKYNMDCSA